jgi:hypothetical protein
VDTQIRLLTILVILLAFAATALAIQFARRRRDAFPLIAMPAYDALPLTIGTTIESGRPALVALGGDGLGGIATPLALANAEFAYQAARRAAIGANTPVITTNNATMIPLAHGTLRRAYESRGRINRLNWSQGVQWYGSGQRSLAYAAILTGVMSTERTGGSLFAGTFGAELALPLLTSARNRTISIAAPTDIEGQAVAYAMADHALLGDGLFVAGAYLDDSKSQLGGVVAQTVLRYTVIICLIVPAIVVIGDSLTDGAISRAIQSIFGGGG